MLHFFFKQFSHYYLIKKFKMHHSFFCYKKEIFSKNAAPSFLLKKIFSKNVFLKKDMKGKVYTVYIITFFSFFFYKKFLTIFFFPLIFTFLMVILIIIMVI